MQLLSPKFIRWILAVLAGGLAGALWASVPGLLKAYRNVNVVISSIMMNYIGMLLVIEGVKKFMYNPTGAEYVYYSYKFSNTKFRIRSGF